MAVEDYLVGLGAFGVIILYYVFIVLLLVVSWFIGGYVSTMYLHFDGWLWWGSTILVMLMIWGLIGAGNNQLNKD